MKQRTTPLPPEELNLIVAFLRLLDECDKQQENNRKGYNEGDHTGARLQ